MGVLTDGIYGPCRRPSTSHSALGLLDLSTAFRCSVWPRRCSTDLDALVFEGVRATGLLQQSLLGHSSARFLARHKTEFWDQCCSCCTLPNCSTSSLLEGHSRLWMILKSTSVHLLNPRQEQSDSSSSVLNKSMCGWAAIT